MAVTRGKEQALIFTDDKDGLLKAMSRPDDPMSATELAESQKQADTQSRLGGPCRRRCHRTDSATIATARQQPQLIQDMSHER